MSASNDTAVDELADIDLKDPELSKAALKIQGKFRLKNKKPGTSETPADDTANGADSTAATTADQQKNDDVADIDLQDPELEKVALKMQSTFRKKQ